MWHIATSKEHYGLNGTALVGRLKPFSELSLLSDLAVFSMVSYNRGFRHFKFRLVTF